MERFDKGGVNSSELTVQFLRFFFFHSEAVDRSLVGYKARAFSAKNTFGLKL